MTEAAVVTTLRTFLAALNEEAKHTMRHERVVDNASAYSRDEIEASLLQVTSAITAASVASTNCYKALAEYDAQTLATQESK